MQYYAMIDDIGYMQTNADNDDSGSRMVFGSYASQGAGLYKRWLENGMRVAVFLNGDFLRGRRMQGMDIDRQVIERASRNLARILTPTVEK